MVVAHDVPQDLLDLLNLVDYKAIPRPLMAMIQTGLGSFTNQLPRKQTPTKGSRPTQKQVAADIPQKLLDTFNRISYQHVPAAQYQDLYNKLRQFIASGNVPLK